MPKLTRLKPAIGALSPRIGHAQGDERTVDRKRTTEHPWRAWYKTKRWRDLKWQAFERDGFKCQRTGVWCVARYPAPNSPVANHKRPHRGDPALFWDIDNIETVTKEVHDRLIQQEEQSVPLGRWD